MLLSSARGTSTRTSPWSVAGRARTSCDLSQNYWLVPFLWSGRLNIISVDSSGNPIQGTPITLTIHNPAPLDTWLTGNFERVFGDDPQALAAFEADLYPTNQTMTVSGEGRLSVVLNQTSLVPPLITIDAGGVSLSGNFTFAPVFVNSTIGSVPNSLNGTVFERQRHHSAVVLQHAPGQPGIPSYLHVDRISHQRSWSS